jgi:phosphonopyruvate decarboxylase
VALDSPRLPSGSEVAETVRRSVGEDSLVISTTGHLSRHLFAAGDRPLNFYMQGSMGHAAALALGYCTAHPDGDVVVLDGDGAVLMHLGVLSTIGAAAPRGLTHIVVDNGGYVSTGGQPASTRHTDLTAVALACGYRSAISAASTAELSSVLDALRGVDGPHFVLVESRSTADPPPPRPSAAVRLPDLAARITGRSAGSTP